MRDVRHALDIDVALAERARDEAWADAFETNDEPDWFVSMLKLVMALR